MSEVWASQLPPEVRELLRVLNRIGYGFVENLPIAKGRPVLSPPPRIIRELKLEPGSNRSQETKQDFILKGPMLQLVRRLELIGDGSIPRIEVRGGVPFRLILEGLDE